MDGWTTNNKNAGVRRRSGIDGRRQLGVVVGQTSLVGFQRPSLS